MIEKCVIPNMYCIGYYEQCRNVEKLYTCIDLWLGINVQNNDLYNIKCKISTCLNLIL